MCPIPPLLDDAEDFVLAQDDVLVVVDLDLGAGVLPEEDLVADLHLERDSLAGLVELAGADRDDLAFHRLLFRGVGDDDPTLVLLRRLEPLDEDAVVEGLYLHVAYLRASDKLTSVSKLDGHISTCRRRVPTIRKPS